MIAMNDLSDRFRSLDGAPAPDLWFEITQRTAVPVPRLERSFPPVARFAPLALAAAAAGVAILIGIGLLLRAPSVGPPAPVATPAASAAPSSRTEFPQGPVPSIAVPSGPASNGWIAYSTRQHTADEFGNPNRDTGSDIFMARAGDEPRLIADRDGGVRLNVCPVFSPEGSMLAYGERDDGEWSIVVLAVDSTGITHLVTRIPVSGAAEAICPRWSADSRRLVYTDATTNFVYGLDGSAESLSTDQPLVGFEGTESPDGPLESPDGEWIAEVVDCNVVVSRPDGSDVRALEGVQPCPYGVAAWSPDGRQVLYALDVGGAFRLLAVPVDDDSQPIQIEAKAPTNHERDWPRQGDVSWQAVYP